MYHLFYYVAKFNILIPFQSTHNLVILRLNLLINLRLTPICLLPFFCKYKMAIFVVMMRILGSLTLFIILFSLKVNAQTYQNPFFNFDEIIDIEKSNYIGKTNFSSNTYTDNYDVKYYRLNLIINPDNRYIKGQVTIHFVPNQTIQSIFIDLNTALTIDSIQHNNLNVSFLHTNNRIEINQSFSKNQFDSITINYQGEPPLNSSSFKASSHDNTPIIWTLSEPYGALDWWPCKQTLTDKADSVDMYITSPKGNKVAGVGKLISEVSKDNNIISHWKSRYPIVTYLVAFAVTPYAEISFNSNLSKGSLFVQNYVYREDSAEVAPQLLVTDTLLQFYDSIIGEYPFMKEKYGHAQFGRGGGMEHQTMSFMNHFGFALNAHEMAHQWFGDKITCGSWQDLWLNEGFATYFAGLPLETMYDGEFWIEWKERYLDRATLIANESVFVHDTSNVSRLFDPYLTYAKGGYVLHMLRKQIGDDSFFEGIRSYMSDPELIYGTALTTDFFKHMEISADTNLTLFQNQWIYGKGYPSYNLEWEKLGTKVNLSLSQITADPSVTFFYVDVPILITGNNGEEVWLKIKHVENNQKVSLTIPFEIHSIQIDPKLDLISKSNFVINTQLIAELKLYPNPTNDILYIALGKDYYLATGYQIISSDGKIIQQNLSLNQTGNLEIDVKNLNHGTYQITIFTENKEITKGFVVAD